MSADRVPLKAAGWATVALLLTAGLGWLLFGPLTRQPAASQAPPSGIVIDQLHIFLTPLGERVQVSEYYLLGNETEAPYTGNATDDDLPVTVIFPLPEGAIDVRFDEGAGDKGRYRPLNGGIADSKPIPPGVATLEARLIYEIPMASEMSVVRPLPLPVASAVLLVAGERWQLQGPELASLGLMEAGDQTVRAYLFEPAEARPAITFTLIDAPPSSPRVAQHTLGAPGIQIGLGILALLAAGVGAWTIWRSRPLAAPPSAVRASLVALADLDDQYATGELSAPAYQGARAVLKRRIREQLEAPEAAMDAGRRESEPDR